MQEPVSLMSWKGQEHLVNLELFDQTCKIGDCTDNRYSDVELACRNFVADDTHDMEAVLRKHVHAADEHLASGARAHHENTLRPHSLPAQPRLVLAEQIALTGHQDGCQQNRRDECES